jgi:hypothetical protein
MTQAEPWKDQLLHIIQLVAVAWVSCRISIKGMCKDCYHTMWTFQASLVIAMSPW